ncbi:MAG: tetratricopeptide repeat protein, partial [Bacteroidota bacterium]
LWLNYQVGALKPMGYHSINLLFHLLNVGLAFAFLLILSRGQLWLSLVAAGLFAIHPIHVESVTWVAERKDVLYVFFFLLGLIMYVRWLRGGPKFLYYWCLVLFVLSCLSKAMAVVFPLILFLLDYWESERPQDRSIGSELSFFFRLDQWINKIPFLLIALGFGLLAVKVQSEGGAVGEMETFTYPQRFMFAGYGFLMYIKLLFTGGPLSTFYPYPNLTADGTLPVIFNLAPFLVLGILLFAVWTLKRGKLIFTGIFFYLFSVLLVLQFLSVGQVVMADRYAYLPYIGLGLILGGGFQWLAEQLSAKGQSEYLLLVPISLIFGLFSYQTFERSKVWKDSETLWTNVIEQYPHVGLPYKNRGNHRAQLGQIDAALQDLDIARQLLPNDAALYESLGNTYASSGKVQQAIPFYNRAIELDPEKPSAVLNRAIALSQIRNFDAAFTDYQRALDLGADPRGLLPNRGYAFLDAGRYQESIRDYQEALRYIPNQGSFYLYIGINFLNLGDKANARTAFTNAQRLGQSVEASLLQRAQ